MKTSEELFIGDSPFTIRIFCNKIQTNITTRIKGGAIFLCTAGSCRIFIDTCVHDITEGCECIILPETTIMFSECSNDFSMTAFSCSDEMFSQAIRKFDPDFFSHISSRPVYKHSEHINEINTGAYLSLLKSIQDDTDNKYRTIIATNILRSFMLNVYDKVQKHTLSKERKISVSRQEELYNEFIRLLHNYGREHHDVAFYSDKLCITTRYLASITSSAVAKESPKQTIAAFLIQEIKILLTFSELTLQQISDSLHFPDQSHLGRFFKQRTGISPLTYRKREMVM